MRGDRVKTYFRFTISLSLRTLAVLVALQMMLGCLCFCGYAREEDASLLTNGNLESGLSNWISNRLEATAAVDSSAAHRGNGGLKLVGSDKEQYIYQYVNIDRSKCYELSVWIKTENMSTMNGVFMGLLALNDGKAIGWVNSKHDLGIEARKIISTGGTHGWTKFSAVIDGSRFDNEANQCSVYFYMDSGVRGKAYVDDINFKEVDFAVIPQFERFQSTITKDEPIGVKLKIYNNTGYARKINFEYTVTDDMRSPVTHGSGGCEVRAYTTKEYFLEMGIERLGTFQFTIHTTSDDGSIDSIIKNSVCIVMQDNSNNMLDDYGLAGHVGQIRSNGATPEQSMQFSAFGGAGRTRDEYRWEFVEPAKGMFRRHDGIYKAYTAFLNAKQKVHITLGYGNVNYDMPHIAIVPTSEVQLEGWRRYCSYVAQEVKSMGFKDEDVVFGVWNEYSGGMGNRTNVPSTHYVNILKIAYEEVKKIMPGCMVATDGMAHVTKGEGIERFTQYLETGVPNYCDAIDIHPYANPNQPDDDDLYENAIADFRNLLEKYGYDDMPFHMTELGANVLPDDAYGIRSTREQAIAVIRFYVLNKKTQAKYGQYDVLYWYKRWEESYSRASEQYGLGNAPWNIDDGAARLGYASFNALATLMNGAEYQESNDRGNVKIHRFKTASGKDMLVMWTSKDSEEISVKCTGKPDFYDMAGTKINIPVANEKFEMTLTREPVFVIGNLPTAEYAAGDITLSIRESTCYKGNSFKVTIIGSEKYAGKKMTITPDIPDGWKLVNNDYDMSGDGKYNIEIYAPSDSFGNSKNHIKLYVNIDGMPVTRLDYLQETIVPLSSSVKRVYEEYEGEMRDLIKISVNNESSGAEITGYVSVLEPKEIIEKNGRHNFVLKPGAVEYIYIPVEQYPEIGYHSFKYEVHQTEANLQSYSQLMSYLNIAYTDLPPTIDGFFDEDEWAGAKPVNIVDPVYFDSSKSEADPVPPDTTGILYTKWDMDNLYIAAVVNDDKHFNNQPVLKLWDGDSVQFAIDTNAENPNSTHWVEYTVALTDRGVLKEQDRLLANQTEKENPNIKAAVIRDDNAKKTIYEIAVPWSETIADGSQFDPEGMIGFSFAVNDHDGIVRKGYTHYMLGITNTKNKSEFARINFVDIPNLIREITLFENNPRAIVNEEVTYMDLDNTSVCPIMRSGRILVPIRFISEKFGARVDWDEATQEVTVTKGNTKLKFTINSEIYYKNDTAIAMDTTAREEQGSMYLPLRVIAEGLGKYVYWNDKGVIIISTDYCDYTDEDVEKRLETVQNKQRP